MKPGNETVNMLLGVTRARQQGTAQIEQMKRYAKENPQDVNVRVRPTQMFGFGRQIEAATPYVEELWQLKPTDPKIYSDICVRRARTFTSCGFSLAYLFICSICAVPC